MLQFPKGPIVPTAQANVGNLVARDFGAGGVGGGGGGASESVPAQATARYWRVFGVTAGTYAGGALSEVEFFANPADETPLTGSGTAIGGTEAFGGTHEGAFDNDINTNYIGNTTAVADGTSWVGYDFGSDVTVGAVQITARNSGDSEQMWTAFNLEYSDNGTDWTALVEFTGVPFFNTAAETRVFNGDYPAGITFQLDATDRADASAITEAEIGGPVTNQGTVTVSGGKFVFENNEHIESTQAARVQMGTRPFSMVFEGVTTSSIGTTQGLASNWVSAGGLRGWLVSFSGSAARVLVSTTGSNFIEILSSGTLSSDTEYKIEWRRDVGSSDLKLLIDDVLVDTYGFGVDVFPAPTELEIGQYDNAEFIGEIGKFTFQFLS